MNFLNSGKPVIFCGQPKSRLPAQLTPAQLCALTWARSNFSGPEAPEIMQVERKGSHLTVITGDQDIIEFTFPSELDAMRVFKQLPQAQPLTNQFGLAADVDQHALNVEMNFGRAPEMKTSLRTGRDFSPA